MKAIVNRVMVSLLLTSMTPLRAGNFPLDAWGKSYLRDVDAAIEYVENHASHLVVEPPPEDESETTQNEIAYLHEIAESRSAKDIIRIHKEHLDPEKQFLKLLDTDKESSPAVHEFIQFVTRESYLPILYFKHKFSRTRPYQIDPSLVTVIDGPPHASYPSGHATQAYLIALILADMLEPQDPRQQALIELGLGIGRRREVAGVHYPSDTSAGVDLALQLQEHLMQNPDFQIRFQAAQKELSNPKE